MTKKVTLYYASWCPHCVSYKPEWDEIKKILKKNGIKTEEYEHGESPEAINKANVNGFPTLHLDDGSGTIEQIIDRSTDGILSKLNIKSLNGGRINNQFNGGGFNNQLQLNDLYYRKYMKYKSKYLSSIKRKKGGASSLTGDDFIAKSMQGTIDNMDELIKNFMENEDKKIINKLMDGINTNINNFTVSFIKPNLYALSNTKNIDDNDNELESIIKDFKRLSKANDMKNLRDSVMEKYYKGTWTFMDQNVNNQIIFFNEIFDIFFGQNKEIAARQIAPKLLAHATVTKQDQGNTETKTHIDWSLFLNTNPLSANIESGQSQEYHVNMALLLLVVAAHLIREGHADFKKQLFAEAEQLFYQTLYYSNKLKNDIKQLQTQSNTINKLASTAANQRQS